MIVKVLVRTLGDQRRSLLGWAMGFAALAMMYVAIYPSFAGNRTYSDLLNQMPESLRHLFSAVGDLTTGPGYISVELLSVMGPLLILAFTISVGSASIARDEERRTLDLLFAVPSPRSDILFGKALAMLVSSAFLVLLLGTVLGIGGRWVDMGLSFKGLFAAMVHLWLLGVEFGVFAMMLSAATGRLGLSRAVPAMAAAVAYVLNGLAPMVDWLVPAQPWSPFYHYIGNSPLTDGFDWQSIVITTTVALALLGAALIALTRRDIAG